MSRVYSFRLSDKNPREIQAREVLESWISKGYSLRQIVTNALLTDPKDNDSSKGVEMLVGKIEMLLEKFEQYGLRNRVNEDLDTSLPTIFLNSISKAIKPGVNIDSSD